MLNIVNSAAVRHRHKAHDVQKIINKFAAFPTWYAFLNRVNYLTRDAAASIADKATARCSEVGITLP